MQCPVLRPPFLVLTHDPPAARGFAGDGTGGFALDGPLPGISSSLLGSALAALLRSASTVRVK